MIKISVHRNERVIKLTRSRCPTCRTEVPARVVERDGSVFMEKECAEHGAFDVMLQRDARWYFESHGDPANAGGACCGPQGCCAPTETAGATSSAGGVAVDPFERLSTCVALIEIVDSCNLTCPTCYAESPYGVGDDLRFSSFDDVAVPNALHFRAKCGRRSAHVLVGVDFIAESVARRNVHGRRRSVCHGTRVHSSTRVLVHKLFFFV